MKKYLFDIKVSYIDGGRDDVSFMSYDLFVTIKKKRFLIDKTIRKTFNPNEIYNKRDIIYYIRSVIEKDKNLSLMFTCFDYVPSYRIKFFKGYDSGKSYLLNERYNSAVKSFKEELLNYGIPLKVK